MKTLLATMAAGMIFMSAGAANATDIIEVILNGKHYSCSSQGTPSNDCDRLTKRAREYFQACLKGYDGEYCLDKAYSRIDKPADCPAWEKACHTDCLKSYDAEYCVDRCY